MKKSLLLILAFFTFILCNAQVKTHSNYDVDGDGNVAISDVTKTVNKVLGKAADNRTVADGESLNAAFQEILSQLASIKEQLAELKNNSCSCNGGSSTDPYNGHEHVDLGLPSGLKWATCNVGANSPEEYGDYFAWGETEPYYTEGHSQDNPCLNWKTNKTAGYDWPSYKLCNGSYISQNKYCTSSSFGTVIDNKTILDPEDDAAHVNWGSDWRMPTKEEQDELRTNCTWTWGSRNGINGYIVVGPNGSFIFLPAVGYRRGGTLSEVGNVGHYWSSSLTSDYSDIAYYLSFGSSDIDWSIDSRCCGLTIRPVCP